MALNTPRAGRPDHTKKIVGNTDDVMHQESGTGKQVYRRGGTAEQADIDVGLKGSGIDVASATFDSGAKNAGGAEALAGRLSGATGSAFNVIVDWLNDNNEVTISRSDVAAQSTTDIKFNFTMDSDRFKVRIQAISSVSSCKVNGTINAH